MKFSKRLMLFGATAAWLCGMNAANAQTLVINEFLASNQSVNVDEDQQASDWIELYNAGNDSLALSGYTLTDEADQPKQWPFPAMTLGPKQYVLVWASGKNRVGQDSLHANFKLNAAGEFIGLYAPNGEVVDTLTFGPQTTDHSYGRLPDGDSSFTFFRVPTPEQANRYSPLQDAVVRFSQAEGVYKNSVTVALETNAGNSEIRYTRNGNEPKKSSALYREPLALSKSTVVRARVFVGDSAVSAIATATYLVHDDPRLPILSLVTAPANLWDPATGIHANPLNEGYEWERPAQLALIEEGVTKFSSPVGVRIHGGSSRATAKKSFRVYFRSDYGQSALHYRLFPQKKIDRFETLVLYASDHSDGTVNFTLIDDALTHSLWLEIGGAVSAFRPVALYLNGEYWGVYWLREHVNKDYVTSNFGVTDMDLQRIVGESAGAPEHPEVKAGDTIFWIETHAFFSSTYLGNTQNYALAKSRYLYLENFLDYHLINIFAANSDWPQNNLDRFRDRAGDPRWRWIMWDTEVGWNHSTPTHLTLEWATRDQVRTDLRYNDEPGWLWTTMMLRRLLENEEFRTLFINRFADLLNTLLTPGNVQDHITMLAEWIRPEMAREITRWEKYDVAEWDRNLQEVRDFAKQRGDNMRQQMMDKFDLRGTATVALLPAIGKGQVTLNTITPDSLPWRGAYFLDVPITVKAAPAPGYAFQEWSDRSLPTEAEFTLSLENDLRIRARFRELLQAREVKVVARKDTSALIQWTTNRPAFAQVEYGLDTAYALKSKRTTANSATHQILLTALRPNTLYHFRVRNWEAQGDSVRSEDFTFRTEDVITGVFASSTEGIPREFYLSPNFPNPFGNATQLRLQLPSAGRLLVAVYNVFGQEVMRVYEGAISPGYKILHWSGAMANGQQASNGAYLLRVQFEKADGGLETASARLVLKR